MENLLDTKIQKHFVIEFDYFNNRDIVFKNLNKIAKKQSIDILTGFSVFINNIPTSLEFYAFLAYEGNSNIEINEMKKLLTPLGIYRPDISIHTLLIRLSERGFNSYSITPCDLDSKLILETFAYSNKKEVPSYNFFSVFYKKKLINEGYKAFEKLKKETTIFLSHSSKQKEMLLDNVVPYLNSLNELVWIDKYRIEQDVENRIVKREIAIGLNEANKIIFYVTLDFLNSYWCNLELEIALSVKAMKSKDYFLFFIVEDSAIGLLKEKYKNEFINLPVTDFKILILNNNIENVVFEIKKFIEKK